MPGVKNAGRAGLAEFIPVRSLAVMRFNVYLQYILSGPFIRVLGQLIDIEIYRG